MRAACIATCLCLAALGNGCGAKAPAPTSAPERAVDKPSRPTEYERILGAHTVKPHLVIYLTPALCERHLATGRRSGALASLEARFAAVGHLRGRAAVALNRGAVQWSQGRPDAAYADVMRARQWFARLGDMRGLAHAYEWLGYMFAKSRSRDQAHRHLGIAYEMFVLLGDARAGQRVLGYARRE